MADVTYSDMATAQPFQNTLDVGELQGKYIKELFETTTSEYYYGRRSVSVSLLPVSGLKIVYDLSQAEGSRVTSIKVRCRECDVPIYEDLDLEKYYRVVLNSFLVDGGDGYTVISDNIRNHKVGEVDIDVFVRYLEEKSPIIQEIEGRLTFTGNERIIVKFADLI